MITTMKEQIEAARGDIQSLQEQQNKIFEFVAKQCNVDEEWLWEYLFNCTAGENSAYADMVRNRLFGEGGCDGTE